jgi:site-specific DNA recombinase
MPLHESVALRQHSVKFRALKCGTVLRRYLELGSMGALIADLDRSGIRAKAAVRPDGSVLGGIRFGVGPLAYLLRNRFYRGELVYWGEVPSKS